MLSNKITNTTPLAEVKEAVQSKLPDNLKAFVVDDNAITEISFPQLEIPLKVSSLNFDKNEVVEGVLTGIKGQYIILDNKSVLNIRKFGGYKVKLSF